MEEKLSQERLRQLMSYSPETGLFTNLVTRSHNAPAGRINTTLDSDGYVQIGIDNTNHKAHRLAWLYSTGQWPNQAIDHINGDRSDNRISNLRDVALSINSQNMRSARSDNKTGILGVSFDKSRNRFLAQIFVAGKKFNLGRFKTADLASAAYLSAKRNLHSGATI